MTANLLELESFSSMMDLTIVALSGNFQKEKEDS